MKATGPWLLMLACACAPSIFDGDTGLLGPIDSGGNNDTAEETDLVPDPDTDTDTDTDSVDDWPDADVSRCPTGTPRAAVPTTVTGQLDKVAGVFDVDAGAFVPGLDLGDDAAHPNAKDGSVDPIAGTVTYVSWALQLVTVDTTTRAVVRRADLDVTRGGIHHLAYDAATDRILATTRDDTARTMTVGWLDPSSATFHPMLDLPGAYAPVMKARGVSCVGREYLLVTRDEAGARTLWRIDLTDWSVLQADPLAVHLGALGHDPVRDAWFAEASVDGAWTIARFDPSTLQVEPIGARPFGESGSWAAYDVRTDSFVAGCEGSSNYAVCIVDVATGATRSIEVGESSPHVFVVGSGH